MIERIRIGLVTAGLLAAMGWAAPAWTQGTGMAGSPASGAAQETTPGGASDVAAEQRDPGGIPGADSVGGILVPETGAETVPPQRTAGAGSTAAQRPVQPAPSAASGPGRTPAAEQGNVPRDSHGGAGVVGAPGLNGGSGAGAFETSDQYGGTYLNEYDDNAEKEFNWAWLAYFAIPVFLGAGAAWWVRHHGTPRERHPAP